MFLFDIISKLNSSYHQYLKCNSINFLDDPFEKVDLSEIYPNLVRDLSKKLDEFIMTTVDPLNPLTLMPDPNSNPKYFGDKWSPGLIILI